MKHTEIEELLELYYNGESSDLQEAQLLTFFKQEEVPCHLEVDKKLFLTLRERASLSEINVPINLEAELSIMIDNVSTKRKRSNIIPIWVGGIVASLILFISIGYSLIEEESEDVLMAQIETQRQIVEALTLVSTKLNYGINECINADSKISNSIAVARNSLNLRKNEN